LIGFNTENPGGDYDEKNSRSTPRQRRARRLPEDGFESSNKKEALKSLF
jgi:hypothetical protein